MLLFALQGDAIASRPGDVARIALPLLACFVLMFAGSFALGRALDLGHPRTTTLTAGSAGRTGKDRPEVLFVCVHNAGRSQMAAALLEHRSQGRVLVRSTGSAPADEVNPGAVAAGRTRSVRTGFT